MTKQQTIVAVERNITNLEQLYLSAPEAALQGIREAIEALDDLLVSLQD